MQLTRKHMKKSVGQAFGKHRFVMLKYHQIRHTSKKMSITYLDWFNPFLNNIHQSISVELDWFKTFIIHFWNTTHVSSSNDFIRYTRFPTIVVSYETAPASNISEFRIGSIIKNSFTFQTFFKIYSHKKIQNLGLLMPTIYILTFPKKYKIPYRIILNLNNVASIVKNETLNLFDTCLEGNYLKFNNGI